MLRDKGLLALFSCIFIILAIGMLSHDISYWWIAGFVALLFYGSLITELVGFNEDKWDNCIDDESQCWPKDWETYKAGYKAPDEYNLPNELAKPKEHRHPDITVIVKDKNNYCKECGYLVCVCKPVVN